MTTIAGHAPAPRDEERGRSSVRVLVIALAIQFALAGAAIYFAVAGWPFVGGGRHATAVHVDRRFQSAGALAGVPTPKTDRFDAAGAMRLLRRQVTVYGFRPAGSKALQRLAIDLRGRLPRGRLEAIPRNPGLRNVIGTIPGRLPAIVVGAHYDVFPEPPGYLGANDGAGGTAVVVELARALRRLPAPRGAREIRFVLFDGEELPLGKSDFLNDALRGSKAYVRAHPAEVRAMVLLDYVANRGLQLPREERSTPALWHALRAAASRVGTTSVFPSTTQGGIDDDHTPFLDAGLPAIDLIDFAYPSRDTLEDTVDKISERSLDVTGETVLDLLAHERRR